MIFGALAALIAAWWGASTVLVVVFLLLGVLPLLWRLSQYFGSNPAAWVNDAPAGYWADWLGGWYWQTDESHRLVVLKPDRDDSHVWLQAQRWMNNAGPLWACWADLASGLDESQRVILSVLEVRMKSRGALDMDPLPWPVGVQTPALAGTTRCVVKGVPRWGGRGQFLGYHGVWLREASDHERELAAVVAPAHDGSASGSIQAADRETEQEMLRYALSHDLRAPLRVVDGFARILKEDYSKSLDRIGNDHLDRVLAASTRMNGMIDAILAQAQLSQTALQRERVDLSALAREIAQEQLGARQADVQAAGQALAEVNISIADGLVAQADTPLVHRVLDNLIGNALKYSSKVPKPCIEVGLVAATDPEVYFVRDNGAGFDMQHADKLFGLFQRLHSTKEFPGTGVGLAGVQNIIHRHGGRVWAEAAPGQGACFYFTLQPSVATVALKGVAGSGSVHRPQA